ncbi:MAG: zf-HC2 domain-containing protein [Bacillota bacterium]
MCFPEGTLQAYLDGELTSRGAAEIRAHLEHWTAVRTAPACPG